MWSGACTWECTCACAQGYAPGHVCLYYGSEACTLASVCACAHMRRCLCVVVDRTQSLSSEITDVEWAVLGRLGREARTAVGLTGGGMGPGLLGLRAHRMQGLQAGGLPQACQQHQWDQLHTRAVGKAMPWQDTTSHLASAGTTLTGFPSPGTKSCSSLEG